jgi:hypothetical protein
LDDLVSFMEAFPELIVQKHHITQLSATSGSFWVVCAKTTAMIGVFAKGIVTFCSVRKCRIVIKIKGQTIIAEAPTASEVEQLLRASDVLFIHRDK